jgi:hypothetical protein
LLTAKLVELGYAEFVPPQVPDKYQFEKLYRRLLRGSRIAASERRHPLCGMSKHPKITQ